MSLFGVDPPGATPLTDEDLEGLKPTWITTRGELDQAEADNIASARLWVARARRPPFWYLDVAGLKSLHQRMLGDVWTWAGTLRTRQTNLGLEASRIYLALHDLCEDTKAQADPDRPAYPIDELAVRFHHRLVSIHPFPNGNGRHSRLAADLLLADLGGQPFTWGGTTNLTTATETRRHYLDALHEADQHNITDLLDFARHT